MYPAKIECSQDNVFRVGDVVECVKNEEGQTDYSSFKGPCPWLQVGGIYKITWTGYHPVPGDVVNVNADPDWFVERHAWTADMFRHLNDLPDEELIRQIKDCKPKSKSKPRQRIKEDA